MCECLCVFLCEIIFIDWHILNEFPYSLRPADAKWEIFFVIFSYLKKMIHSLFTF